MKKAKLLPPAKFCKHGNGVDFGCGKCPRGKRIGVHEVLWDAKRQAYVWPLPKK